MIGRTTFLWLLLAALAGYGLFQVKYEVVTLEEELTRLNTATLREQNQIHVLEAEWSYLNQPQRLEELNERYLHLKPIDPAQFGNVASLPPRPEPIPGSEPGTRLPGTEGMIARMIPPRRPALPEAPRRTTPRAPLEAVPPAQTYAASLPTAMAAAPIPAVLPASATR